MQTPPISSWGCLHFMKISELFDGFIKNCKSDDLDKYTIGQHEKICRKVIAPAIGEMEIESLLPIHANKIKDFAATFCKTLPWRSILTFRKLLRYAKNCGIKTGVIAEEIKIPRYKRQNDVRAWSENEISEIRNDILKDYSSEFSKHTPLRQRMAHPITIARTRALLETMTHSGIRLKEALSLDIANIDFEEQELRVRDCKDKKEWKTVFLHGALPAIRAYLDLRTDKNPALFVSVDGKRLLFDTAQSTMKRIKKRIRKKNQQLNFPLNHKTCRKTFVTIPLRAGHDPKKVQLLSPLSFKRH
jgi:site-specific recombinase XerD